MLTKLSIRGKSNLFSVLGVLMECLYVLLQTQRFSAYGGVGGVCGGGRCNPAHQIVSRTHVQLMPQNLVVEVILATLTVSQSPRVTEVALGIIGGDQGYNDSGMMQRGDFEHRLSMRKDGGKPFPRTLWIDRSRKQIIRWRSEFHSTVSSNLHPSKHNRLPDVDELERVLER
ncbi:Armadillo-like helical [Artemisia annua]|uniref:Armadillo-like helical n=1 Tax=Artemisia annua TaxID=35608 RepID=A0A2U1KLT1_ARTAN|nr:Armadillo-like helical [Artemisia annua]